MHAAELADAAADDRDIVQLLQSGAAERAFEQLLARYESKLFRLCCALMRDSTQAQDVAQESLVRIWKALPSYDGRASLSTWIYTITRNRCLSALQRRRDLDCLDDNEDALGIAARDEDALEREGLAQQLRELVQSLPERHRRVLTLFYYEERSVSELAQMLGMPDGTVKTLLFRARAALNESLRRRGLADPALWLETSA